MDARDLTYIPLADRRAMWAKTKDVSARDGRILAAAKAHHAAEHELLPRPNSWFRCDRKLQHIAVAQLVLDAADKVDPLRQPQRTTPEREARRDAFARMICSTS